LNQKNFFIDHRKTMIMLITLITLPLAGMTLQSTSRSAIGQIAPIC